jgi:methyltransferase
MVSVDLYLVLLASIAAQRLAELAITRRHTRHALAFGGIEYGRGHFAWMRLLHAAFLVCCALEVIALDRPFTPALGLPMLALVFAAQALRLWTMRSLGPWWNARVVVVPGMRIVTRGPYRYHRHPNYAAVVVEGFAIPLVHGAWITALVFSLANALLLAVRIRCEEGALLRHTDYGARFGLDAGLPQPAEDGA